MEPITVTFITTVLNEEYTMKQLLDSLVHQTRLPDEIVIVDGGSTDKTLEFIQEYFEREPTLHSITHLILQKKGNRSAGRNEAISHASGSVIAIADAGCILDTRWLENVVLPFEQHQEVDVVAGYYAGKATTPLQEVLVPYVLVMPDQIDEQTFLPATRSMALRKTVWEHLGGFPEQYQHNEDYVFARKLKSENLKIWFARDAVVYWIPPKTVQQAYRMFYRFALGDAEAGIFRPKVVLLLVRYVLGIILFFVAFFWSQFWLFGLLFIALLAYITWSIEKNYRYIRKSFAIYYLPFLQFLTDIAVMHGTIKGIIIYVWGTQKTQ